MNDVCCCLTLFRTFSVSFSIHEIASNVFKYYAERPKKKKIIYLELELKPNGFQCSDAAGAAMWCVVLRCMWRTKQITQHNSRNSKNVHFISNWKDCDYVNKKVIQYFCCKLYSSNINFQVLQSFDLVEIQKQPLYCQPVAGANKLKRNHVKGKMSCVFYSSSHFRFCRHRCRHRIRPQKTLLRPIRS